LRAAKEFSEYAQVFISSEKELSGELKAWQLPCAPEDIHHVIYYADLLFGDSATMASEAACLGTPAIYVDDQGRGYTDEQEKKYGLVFNFGTSAAEQSRAVDRAVEILKGVWGSREDWKGKREVMVREKSESSSELAVVSSELGESRGELGVGNKEQTSEIWKILIHVISNSEELFDPNRR
jgi:hypothetical protein